jgi:hypothetical protein
LDSCIFLGANSSYSALEDDQVYLEEENEVPHSSSSRESINDVPSPNIVADRSTEFIIELQVKFCFISSVSLSFSIFLPDWKFIDVLTFSVTGCNYLDNEYVC